MTKAGLKEEESLWLLWRIRSVLWTRVHLNSQEVSLRKIELEIKLHAKKFRDAIVRAGKGVLLTLDNFPFGSCGDASILLAEYLEELGYGSFDYVCGSRNDSSHAWIEKDGMIVDITLDGFPENKETVFVGIEHPWHDQFCEDPYRIDNIRIDRWDPHTRANLTRAYHIIRDHVKTD